MRRRSQPVGWDIAKAWARRPLRIQGYEYEDLPSFTNKPHLYKRHAVRARILPVVAALPSDFFQTVTGQRRVGISADPSPWGFGSPDPEAIDSQTPSRAIRVQESPAFTRALYWQVVLGRTAIELANRDAFAGIVIHELSHVFLEHDPFNNGRLDQYEDEAIALTCDLGFRRQAEAHFAAIKEWFGNEVKTGKLP